MSLRQCLMIMHDILLRGIVKLIIALTQLSFSSLTLFRPGFFLLPRTGGEGSGGPTPVTLQPLIV